MALYCRVSTDDQSCERQERDLTAFAERATFAVIVALTSGCRRIWTGCANS